MQDFRKLKVWEKGHQLTLNVYRATMNFPNYELFVLANQLRRSVASIPANIAEGCGQSTGKEMKQALNVARGSATETECHLLLANQLNYISDQDYERLNAEVTEIKRMLTVLMSRIASNKNPSRSHTQIAEQPYGYLLSIETEPYLETEQIE